ncbi:hypothetical protein J6590_037663 [Homalodisca vitripennis]|nr:hypothetical protein J6590_037663 [Homalodisca vitripennis]
MADEELRELELSHQYGSGRWSGGGGGGASWGRSPGGGPPGPGGGSLSHQRMAPQQHHSNRAAEAEDIMGRGQGPRGRSGLYYSPPGTSYTIVERPLPNKQPRGTYLGSSASFNNNNRTPASSKKRPISPEQVLQMLGHNHLKPPPEPHQTRRPVPPPPTMDQLEVRTVSMSRGPADGTHSHGFGICVKGGTKDSGDSSLTNLQAYQPYDNQYFGWRLTVWEIIQTEEKNKLGIGKRKVSLGQHGFTNKEWGTLQSVSYNLNIDLGLGSQVGCGGTPDLPARFRCITVEIFPKHVAESEFCRPK